MLFSNYSKRRSRGDNSTIFTEPEANKCFSLITQVIIEIPKQWNVKFLHVEHVMEE